MGRHLFCCPHLGIDCVTTKQGDFDCEVINVLVSVDLTVIESYNGFGIPFVTAKLYTYIINMQYIIFIIISDIHTNT